MFRKDSYKTESLSELTRKYFLADYVIGLSIHLNQSSGDTYPFEHNQVIRTIGGGGFSTAI